VIKGGWLYHVTGEACSVAAELVMRMEGSSLIGGQLVYQSGITDIVMVS
jgi:hypothetical protein